MWLGMGSFEMALAYVLCILSALWCLVYGLFFWKSEGKPINSEEVVDWDREERELEKGTWRPGGLLIPTGIEPRKVVGLEARQSGRERPKLGLSSAEMKSSARTFL